MHTYNGPTVKGMLSVGLYTVEEIFDLLEESEVQRKASVLNGYKIRSSGRLQLFRKKGITCYKCGLKANLFSLENQTANPTPSPHLNLYALVEDRFVLFTKDHIIPRHYGGPDMLENYETMCSPCNNKRGHGKPKKEAAEAVIAELKKNGYEFLRPITLTY